MTKYVAFAMLLLLCGDTHAGILDRIRARRESRRESHGTVVVSTSRASTCAGCSVCPAGVCASGACVECPGGVCPLPQQPKPPQATLPTLQSVPPLRK